MNTEKPPMVAEGTLPGHPAAHTVNSSTLTIMIRPFLISRFLFCGRYRPNGAGQHIRKKGDAHAI